MVNGEPPFDQSRFLSSLDDDHVRASKRYAALRRAFVKFFEWRHCHSPEDLADETLARGVAMFSRGIPDASSPIKYLYGIARNLLKAEWKQSRRGRTESIDDHPSLSTTVFEGVDARIYLDQLLKPLAPADREVFVRYYTGDRHALRKELGISEVALRVRVHRIKRQVQELANERPIP